MAFFTMRTLAPITLAALAMGCGGNVVVGDGGNGGSGGSGGSTTTATIVVCEDHADCPGGLCVFSTGVCTTACTGDFGTCPTGQVCDPCATSSCAGCKDCASACVSANGLCDDHDDCASGNVCLYGSQKCAPECTDFGGCDDPDLVCNDCATGSCPGCEDCVGACTESF